MHVSAPSRFSSVQLLALQTVACHGFLQARTLEWVAISFPGEFSEPGTELQSSALQGGFSAAELPGKPTGLGPKRIAASSLPVGPFTAEF